MGHLGWSVFLLSLLAIQTGIRAITSLDGLTYIVRYTPPDEAKDDATKMAKIAGYSPMFWVRAWTFLSFLILGGAFWFTWLRNLDQIM